MLNIYVDNNYNDIPNFVFDVEAFFGFTKLKDDEFTRLVLKELEQGEYVSEYSFKDRFGEGLRSIHLSTGSKILLCVYYYPEYTFNGVELGANGYHLLTKCPTGSIYFQCPINDFYDEFINGCKVNNVICNNVNEVNYQLYAGV